jgi:hypothetical protein
VAAGRLPIKPRPLVAPVVGFVAKHRKIIRKTF